MVKFGDRGPGWHGDSKGHHDARVFGHAPERRHTKKKLYRVFIQDTKEGTPKMELLWAKSERDLKRQFPPYYKAMLKAGYITIRPY